MRKIFRRSLGCGVVVLALAVVAFAVAWFRSDNDCAARSASVPEHPMKAIVYCEYGSPDVLKLENLEKPVPGNGQVLVRIHAAALNPLDMHYMHGTPYVMRLDGGLRKPKSTRLGVDFSGVVEAVGPNVTQFKVGDAVFGTRKGAFAEYVVATAANLAPNPGNISFDEAAGIPVAAVTALQALRDKAQVKPGQRVLINGASGGVGTFAVQIAKSMGAHVTGVCSTRNVDLVRSLGADAVVDYTRDDFTRRGERYDAIIDMVGNHSLGEYRGVLNPNGSYVMVGGPKGRWIAPLDRVARMALVSPFVSQKVGMIMARTNRDDFMVLRDLIEKGKVRPVIDRRYTLEQVPEAMRYLETGRARGKIIIRIGT